MSLARFTAAVLLSSATLMAQQIQVSKENKTIAISTSDDASALADVAVVTVGFQSFGKDQNDTYSEASQTSNTIVNALTAAGIPKEAIESTEQTLRPLVPGNDEDKARFEQGLRFQFSQSWRVTVPASQAAKVLQVAIPAGADNSGGIDWQMKDDNALQAEAARKALEHARQIAASMAQGLGAKLGALIYASNQAPIRGLMNGYISTENAEITAQVRTRVAPLAIAPEHISRSATVYAVFAIE